MRSRNWSQPTATVAVPCILGHCLVLLLVLAGCGPAEQQSTPANLPADETPQMQAQQALAGVGKKGQSFKDDKGIAKIITGPAAALANVEQKAVLEFQIPPLLQMFKATEGRFPNSHEEFMSKIVQPNRLKLPELPEGMVYRFNTEKGELWVYPESEAPADN